MIRKKPMNFHSSEFLSALLSNSYCEAEISIPERAAVLMLRPCWLAAAFTARFRRERPETIRLSCHFLTRLIAEAIRSELREGRTAYLRMTEIRDKVSVRHL